jgi:hypothetical protein
MSELYRAANPTIEEAIKYLEGMIFTQDFHPSTLRSKAVNTMAIKALREQAERVLCAKCKHYNKTGCSAGFGWCESMDKGTNDDFYCSLAERSEG